MIRAAGLMVKRLFKSVGSIFVIALIGILLFYAYAFFFIKAREKNISEIDYADIGSIVYTEGRVKNIRHTTYGNVILLLLDETTNASINIFVSANAYENLIANHQILPGAKIGVRGIVEEYEGVLEIFVASAGNIVLLENAYSHKVDIKTLLSNPTVYEGMYVRTEGYIDKLEVLKNYRKILVADSTSPKDTVWVAIEKQLDIKVEYRAEVDIRARTYYNEIAKRVELVVTEEDDMYFSYTENSYKAGYRNLTIAEIHSKFNEGEKVYIRKAIVLNTYELFGTKFILFEKIAYTKYSINCIVLGAEIAEDKNGVPLPMQKYVSFSGFFKYYSPDGCWEICSSTNSIELVQK